MTAMEKHAALFC